MARTILILVQVVSMKAVTMATRITMRMIMRVMTSYYTNMTMTAMRTIMKNMQTRLKRKE